MTRKQMQAIQRLTMQMYRDCICIYQDRLIFEVEPLEKGYCVKAVTPADLMRWFEQGFQAIAFVGSRGGIKGYQVFR